jgi:hypothetical protein
MLDENKNKTVIRTMPIFVGSYCVAVTIYYSDSTFSTMECDRY